MSPRLRKWVSVPLEYRVPVTWQTEDGWTFESVTYDEVFEIERGVELHLNDPRYEALRVHDDRPDLDYVLPSGYAGMAVDLLGRTPADIHREGYLGDGVRVVVIDSGGPGAKSVLGDNGVDQYGHGTLVGDLINGPRTETEFGPVSGNAPWSEVIHIKALNEEGRTDTESMYRALQLAKTLEPDIVNLSVGRSQECDGDCPICTTMTQMRYETGTLFIVASGNEGPWGTVNCPGSCGATLTVGSRWADASEDDWGLRLDAGPVAGFTSRGVTASGYKPDILAAGGSGTAGTPEQWIVGRSTGTLNKGAGFGIERGTSFAAPMVSGIVALLLSSGVKPSKIHRTGSKIP